MDATKKQFLQGVRGVCVKEPDAHRNTPGLLEVLPELAAQLQGAEGGGAGKLLAAFMFDDIAGNGGNGGNGGGGGGSPSKQQKRTVKGDELEFTICRVNGVPLTAYSRGTQCKVVRTKRDRLLAEQVHHMLPLGLSLSPTSLSLLPIICSPWVSPSLSHTHTPLEQVQQMLSAGAVREQGIIETVKVRLVEPPCSAYMTPYLAPYSA